MARLARSEKSGIGNTRIPSSRYWCFTWNNYDEKGVLQLLARLAREVFVFQEENEGTPHLQGYVCFAKKERPMEKVGIKEIHWEKCRSKEHSIAYCSDEKKRKGRIWSNGIRLDDKDYEKRLEEMGEVLLNNDKEFVEWLREKKKCMKIWCNEKLLWIVNCIVNKFGEEYEYIIIDVKDDSWKKLVVDKGVKLVVNY